MLRFYKEIFTFSDTVLQFSKETAIAGSKCHFSNQSVILLFGVNGQFTSTRDSGMDMGLFFFFELKCSRGILNHWDHCNHSENPDEFITFPGVRYKSVLGVQQFKFCVLSIYGSSEKERRWQEDKGWHSGAEEVKSRTCVIMGPIKQKGRRGGRVGYISLRCSQKWRP